MPINTTWTDPTTLDRVGQNLPQTTYEAIVSDLNAVGGATAATLNSAGSAAVTGTGGIPHAEWLYDPNGTTGVLAGGIATRQLSYGRAFASKPAIGAACSTTGAAGSVSYSVTQTTTTFCVVAFKNNDTGTVTLGDFCIIAMGS